MARRGEFQQIAELFAPLAAGYPGALGLTDDAAFMAVPEGKDLVLTMDTIVESVHFLPDDPPDLIARKLVRVNLSDLAAKGAVPHALMLSCAFPQARSDRWREGFARGLAEDVATYAVPVIGGDTVSTPGPASFTLTAFGMVEQGRGLLRSGACDGDLLVVTGTLGDGAYGLLAAQGKLSGGDAESVAWLADRYRIPQPRVSLGPQLIGLARAAMDISDGLLQDLGHMCRASGIGACVEASRLPVSAAASALYQQRADGLALITTGGDDYELLFSCPPDAWPTVQSVAMEAGVQITVIGRCIAGTGVSLLDASGRVIESAQAGFRHF